MADPLAPKHDGGPAFTFTDYDGTTPRTVRGMSLRDYFAGQALAHAVDASVRNNWLTIEAAITDIARQAYTVADAMLKERAK